MFFKTDDERQAYKERLRAMPEGEARLAISEALAKSRLVQEARPAHPPAGWKKPGYGTPDYHRAMGWGWISPEEATEDAQRRERARSAAGTRAVPPARHERPAPVDSWQFAQGMATTAARDDRLTPQAKALLQVLRARAGKGTETRTCKTTLAAIMRRSTRSIQRYIAELVRFGYIITKTRIGRRGLYTGLIISITEKVLPFWASRSGWRAWKDAQPCEFLAFPDRTELSPKKRTDIKNNIIDALALFEPSLLRRTKRWREVAFTE